MNRTRLLSFGASLILGFTGALVACASESDLGDHAAAPNPSAAPTSEGPAEAPTGESAEGGKSDATSSESITLQNGLVSVADRMAFCEKAVACDPQLSMTDCTDAMYSVNSVYRFLPGCRAHHRFVDLINCSLTKDLCTGCNAAWSAFQTSLQAASCEAKTYSIGLGDAFPQPAGSTGDSICKNGVRGAGGWCTKACAVDEECAGKGTNGKNSFGTANVCTLDTFIGGNGCYPTCSSTKDCQNLFGETQNGLRIACKKFDGPGYSASPVCVRVNDNRGTELP